MLRYASVSLLIAGLTFGALRVLMGGVSSPTDAPPLLADLETPQTPQPPSARFAEVLAAEPDLRLRLASVQHRLPESPASLPTVPATSAPVESILSRSRAIIEEGRKSPASHADAPSLIREEIARQRMEGATLEEESQGTLATEVRDELVALAAEDPAAQNWLTLYLSLERNSDETEAILARYAPRVN